MIVDIVIPALDEEQAIGSVVRGLAEQPIALRQIVVADNGSRDRTAQVARAAGARVVYEAERGYGAACLAALSVLSEDPPDVVAFADGDGSDDPADLARLLEPIAAVRADLVLASRSRGLADPGSLTVQQRVGNAVACRALAVLYGARYTDLGPFRAIRWDALERLHMADRNYGWTVEMQIKAARQRLAVEEIPARYRARVGRSKVSGTLRGTVGASAKILWTLARYAW